MANLAPSKVTIQTDQTRDFSDVHNFVKNFVWDPTQSTYWSQSRGASFAPKNNRKRSKQKKKSFRVRCMVQYGDSGRTGVQTNQKCQTQHAPESGLAGHKEPSTAVMNYSRLYQHAYSLNKK